MRWRVGDCGRVAAGAERSGSRRALSWTERVDAVGARAAKMVDAAKIALNVALFRVNRYFV